MAVATANRRTRRGGPSRLESRAGVCGRPAATAMARRGGGPRPRRRRRLRRPHRQSRPGRPLCPGRRPRQVGSPRRPGRQRPEPGPRCRPNRDAAARAAAARTAAARSTAARAAAARTAAARAAAARARAGRTETRAVGLAARSGSSALGIVVLPLRRAAARGARGRVGERRRLPAGLDLGKLVVREHDRSVRPDDQRLVRFEPCRARPGNEGGSEPLDRRRQRNRQARGRKYRNRQADGQDDENALPAPEHASQAEDVCRPTARG